MPSLNEGLPMALLEAMASGLPAIGSNVGDIPKVLLATAGYVVEPGNLQQLTDRMSELSLSAELSQMSLQARRIIEEKFSAEKMTQKYTVMYERIISASQIL